MRIFRLSCLPIVVAGLCCFPSCRTTEAETLGNLSNHPAPARAESDHHMLQSPLVAQLTDYTCGVAALRSILKGYGENYKEADLKRLLGSDPNNGTSYKRMKQFLTEKSYEVTIRTGLTIEDLQKTIAEGYPVIVLLQAWSSDPHIDYANAWDDGHYAVATGYSATRVYFMDPSTTGHYTYIDKSEFIDRWHDVDLNGDEREELKHFGMQVRAPTGAPPLPQHRLDFRTFTKMP